MTFEDTRGITIVSGVAHAMESTTASKLMPRNMKPTNVILRPANSTLPISPKPWAMSLSKTFSIGLTAALRVVVDRKELLNVYNHQF
jgi:hypothetical protein